jgi:hypothetical protein
MATFLSRFWLMMTWSRPSSVLVGGLAGSSFARLGFWMRGCFFGGRFTSDTPSPTHAPYTRQTIGAVSKSAHTTPALRCVRTPTQPGITVGFGGAGASASSSARLLALNSCFV